MDHFKTIRNGTKKKSVESIFIKLYKFHIEYLLNIYYISLYIILTFLHYIVLYKLEKFF